MKLLSRVRLLVTPWTAAYHAPPSMGFSRQEYWSGVPLLSPPCSLISVYLQDTSIFMGMISRPQIVMCSAFVFIFNDIFVLFKFANLIFLAVQILIS